MFITLLTILTIIALIVFGWGIHGRQVDNLPRCRFCKYELRGHKEASDMPAKCPECGSNLTQKKAIISGHRARRPRPANTGIAALVICSLMFTAWFWGRATHFNWAAVMPSWVLVMQVRLDSRSNSENATDELASRLANERLSTAEDEFIVGRALDEQADPHGDWFGRWDSIFESIWNANQITESQANAFAHHFYQWKLQHLSTIRRGQPWSGQEHIVAMCGMPRTPVFIRGDLLKVTVGGKVVYQRSAMAESEFDRMGMDRKGQANSDWDTFKHQFGGIDLPDGTYDVVATRQIWMRLPGTGAQKNIEFNEDYKSTIRIVDQDQPLIKLDAPDFMKSAIESSITLRTPLRFEVDNVGEYPWWAVDARRVPRDVGFSVFFVVNGKEIPAGKFAANAGDRDVHDVGGRDNGIEPFDAETVTVIFRPDATVAEQLLTKDAKTIWGKEIVFNKVPIKFEDLRNPRPARTRPSPPKPSNGS